MAKPIILLFLHFFGALIIHHNGLGLALRIDVSPENYNGLNTDTVNLTCMADGPAHWAKRILTLQLMKMGHSPIVVYSNGRLTKGPNMKQHMKAEGHLDDDASRSYLRLSIQNPTTEDTGPYVCLMVYYNEVLQLKELKAGANLTIAEDDVTAVVKFLMEKVTGLETTLKIQESTIKDQDVKLKNQELTLKNQDVKLKNQESTLKNQDVKLKNQESTLKNQDMRLKVYESKMKNQESTLKNQESTLKNQESTLKNQDVRLKVCESTLATQEMKLKEQEEMNNYMNTSMMEHERNFDIRVNNLKGQLLQQVEKEKIASAFYARYVDMGTLTKGQTLLFPHVEVNFGSNFNKDTGVYTAPVNGLYSFSVFALSKSGGNAQTNIGIFVNTMHITSVVALDGYHINQSSVTHLVQLKIGDAVKCKVNYVNKKGNRLPESVNTGFSGHLIKAL